MRVVGSESECGVVRSVDCEYIFVIDRILVVSIKILNIIIIFYIEFWFMVLGFFLEIFDVFVKVGNVICNVIFVVFLMFMCEIEGVVVGSYKMVIYVLGKGNV